MRRALAAFASFALVASLVTVVALRAAAADSNPSFNANLTNNSIDGWDFGGPVVVTISDPATDQQDSWSGDRIEYDGNSFGLYLDSNAEASPWTLRPGQTITVVGPNGMKNLLVARLAVGGFDLDQDTISGTSDQTGMIEVEVGHAAASGYAQAWPTAGTWTADLGSVVPPYDLRIMDEARISQLDGDGDTTGVGLTLAPPRFVFAPLLQQIVGSDWTAGTPVTLTIHASDAGKLDYTDTTTAGQLCDSPETCPSWQVPATGNPNVFFDLVGTGFLARAGDIITMSDTTSGGTTTKTLTVPDLTVDLGDPATDTFSGTTSLPIPEGGFLTVNYTFDDGVDWCHAAHDVMPGTISIGGSWSVSFSGECEIDPGLGSAVETDPDGDQTAVNAPTVDLRVDPVADRIWAAWPAPADVTLTIDRPGTPPHEQTVGTRNVLTRGSWNIDMWTQPIGDLDAPMMALFDLAGVGGFDIRAGDILTVTDGTTTRSVTVANLTVDRIDALTDTVTGTTTPGQEVRLHLGDAEGGYWGYSTTGGADGAWTFHFDPSEIPNQGLDPGMLGQAIVGQTVVRWTVPSGRGDQTIDFTGPGDQVLGVTPFALVATATSGLPVTFTSSTPAVCTVAGEAVTLVALGTCTITAGQAGDPSYNRAPDVGRSFSVRLGSATTITSDAPDPTVTGQPYVVQVTVRRTSPGNGRPVGTVTISDGLGATCTDTTASALSTRTISFSCTLRSTTAGTRTLTATFNPAAGWAASSGTATHAVKRAATFTLITNAASLLLQATRVGQSYAVTVKVWVVQPGSGTLSGTVTISDGSATCTVSSLSGTGTGSCSLTSNSAGWKTITARYDGNPDFMASQAAVLHRVRAV